MATSAANPTRTPSGILTFLGGIVLLAIFAVIIVIWIKISSRGVKDDVNERRAAGRIQTREALDKEVHEKLTTTAWVDKAKGVARVPVADAIELTVEDLRKKKIAPSQVKV